MKSIEINLNILDYRETKCVEKFREAQINYEKLNCPFILEKNLSLSA